VNGLLVLYVVFGSVVALVLCLQQRARTTRMEAHPLARPGVCLHAMAIRVAAVALGLTMLLVVAGMALRGGT
jgi:hypothetical protein